MTDGVLHVVVPGGIDDPARPSGGNTYDRRLCAALGERGRSVRLVEVEGGWPWSADVGAPALERALTGLPDGSTVLVDGLLASRLPGVMLPASRRLRVVLLVHLPAGVDDVLARLSEQQVVRAAAGVVTPSAWCRDWLVWTYELDPAHVAVARPGVAPVEVAAGTTSGAALLTVGAVSSVKGQDHLLAALADVRDLPWTWTCVGSTAVRRRGGESGTGGAAGTGAGAGATGVGAGVGVGVPHATRNRTIGTAYRRSGAGASACYRGAWRARGGGGRSSGWAWSPCCPWSYLAALNGFANLVLPGLLSRRPDRLQVGWSWVWMWVPGRVVALDGLSVRGQGPNARWVLTADHATGEVDLRALWDRRFRVSDLRADGVSVRYRRRSAELSAEAESRAPPIDGFEGLVETGPVGPPWTVSLGLAALGLGELWLDDYRFVGAAPISGEATLGSALDADLRVGFDAGRVTWGDTTVMTEVRGPAHLTVVDLPRGEPIARPLVRARERHHRGRGRHREPRIPGAIPRSGPWLSLVGTGHLRTDLALDAGTFRTGSVLDAVTRDLDVRFLSYDIVGDGVVHLQAVETDGRPESHLSVAFGAYTIGEAGRPPLVEGEGFSVTGSSPDVSIAVPFTTLDLVLDLPSSRVPNLPLYNDFFPTGVGFALTGGRGRCGGGCSRPPRRGRPRARRC